MLAAPLKVILIADADGQMDGGGESVLVSAQLPNDTADAGRIAAVHQRLAARAGGVQQAGEVVVHPHAVRVAVVVGGTNDGEMLRVASQHRQVFADLDSGNAGGDRIEIAPIADVGVRLHIERFLLRRPTGHIQQDAGLGRAAGRGRRGGGPGCEQLRQ